MLKSKGRGAQHNPHNRFHNLQIEYSSDYYQKLYEMDELEDALAQKTKYVEVFPKTIINEVKSKDVPLSYSMNPYQGCEHGCVYCYARTTHEYWGYSSGLDFERIILYKPQAPELLKKELSKPGWNVMPIMFSGNTDCYQPLERKMLITRKMLEVLHQAKHPVSIITKNTLVLRDIDILSDMAKENLVHVSLSLTSLQEEVRQKLEPRTATAINKLKAITALSQAGIPVNVMVAPIIPGLNDHEVPEIIEKVAQAGALSAHYTLVRLNGSIGEVFEHWVRESFPDRADKVLNLTKSIHGGSLEAYGSARNQGQGEYAQHIHRVFKLAMQRHMKDKVYPVLDCSKFVPYPKHGQLGLF